MAGTDTSSVQIEWVLTELIRNPEVMRNAQLEVRNAIPQNRRVEESDILQAVIKETFRFHPTVPFLLPHKSEEDFEISSYMVPKNTQILINAWALARDPNTWEKPDLFMPERFLGREIDYTGQHFELIPFSSGRRMSDLIHSSFVNIGINCVFMSSLHEVLSPKLVTSLKGANGKVVHISITNAPLWNAHTFALTESDKLYEFGYNNF